MGAWEKLAREKLDRVLLKTLHVKSEDHVADIRGGSRNLIRLWHENIFPSVPNKNYISIQKDDKQ